MLLEQIAHIAIILGVIIIVPQLVFAAFSLANNNWRQKTKSTLDYYDHINQLIKTEKTKIREQYDDEISRDLAILIHEAGVDAPAIDRILDLYERLSLGVNIGIYDLDAIDRASGDLLVDDFRRYQAYIHYCRELEQTPKAWIEFEKLYDELVKQRR